MYVFLLIGLRIPFCSLYLVQCGRLQLTWQDRIVFAASLCTYMEYFAPPSAIWTSSQQRGLDKTELRRSVCKSSSFNSTHGSYSCCCLRSRWVKLHLADSIWFHISKASKPWGPTTVYLNLIILRHLLFTTSTWRQIEHEWERQNRAKEKGLLREREKIKKSREGWEHCFTS